MSLNRIVPRLGVALAVLGVALGVGLGEVRQASAAGEVLRVESRLTLGGGLQAGSASFVETDCIIGQDVIIGVGASLHYSQDAALMTPVPMIVTGRPTAAELWALYE